MVREGATSARSGGGAKVRVMVQDAGVGSVDRAVEEGRGDEEAVEARGTRVGRGGVVRDVEVGVLVVGDLFDFEVGGESVEERSEGSRRKGGGGVGGVGGGGNEVEVATNKGGDGGGHTHHLFDKDRLFGVFVDTRVKVDVE